MNPGYAMVAGILTCCAVAGAAFLGAIASSLKTIAEHLEQISHNTRKEYKDR